LRFQFFALTQQNTRFTKVHCQELSGKNQGQKIFAKTGGTGLLAGWQSLP
jgi:hypothetical protein